MSIASLRFTARVPLLMLKPKALSCRQTSIACQKDEKISTHSFYSNNAMSAVLRGTRQGELDEELHFYDLVSHRLAGSFPLASSPSHATT